MWFVLGCTALCLCVCLPLFLHYKPLKLTLALTFKSLGTLCALVPALIAAVRLDPVYWFFVVALLLHAMADFILDIKFEIGMGVFLLGHLFYAVSFLKLFNLSIAHLILLILLLGTLGYVFYRHRSIIGKQLLPFLFYGIILSVMTACGIAGGATSYSLKGLMIMGGVALFFFSDCLIFLRILYPNHSAPEWLIMAVYYLAQLLLGSSCLF
ncbi:MAG: lysoplasmalogenase [Oscillospiraceae bacterium]|nr:lysoplasmalogenase [Oscillospiraceae bacterium]